MNQTAKEYAYALYELVAQDGETARYRESLCSLCALMDENPEYLTLLNAPNIPVRERLHLIDEAFSGNIPDMLVDYLKVLCQSGNIGSFCDSAEEFCKIDDDIKRKRTAKIVSAVELSDEEKDALIKKLGAYADGEIVPEYQVDPSIIGGFTVTLGDRIIDASVKSRLKEIKEVTG